MMDNQWNVQVIRGSLRGFGRRLIITRGRGSRKATVQFSRSACLAAISTNLLPALSVPDTPLAPLIDRSAQAYGLDPKLGETGY